MPGASQARSNNDRTTPSGRTSTPPRGTASTAQTPPQGGDLPTPPPPVEPVAPGVEVADPATPPADPTETALPSISEVQNKLGLRGAQAVSRAFGAFLGLGLILPLARFVIRRLG
jgi:hypothetical protein